MSNNRAAKWHPASAGLSWAEQRIQATEISPDSVLRQQFLILTQDQRVPGAMSVVTMGSRLLAHGRDLPVACVTLSGAHLAVLGIAVDPEGEVISAARLRVLAARHADPKTLVEWLGYCAGRFALIWLGEDVARLYLDGIGSLGAVYDPETGRVGSTLNLVLTRAPEMNEAYPLTAKAMMGQDRFAFGHTPDRAVRRLLPNHYLDLNDFSMTRHWPGEALGDEPTVHEEVEIVRKIVARLEQVIAALARFAPGNVHLSLSGGLDSRILLACAKPSLSDIRLFSHAEKLASRKEVRIARRLATRVDAPLDEIDPIRRPQLRIMDQSMIEQLNTTSRIITGLDHAPAPEAHEVLLAHAPGGIFLRGNGVDFLKAVLWRRAVREYRDDLGHDIREGIRMMMLSEKQVVENRDIQSMYRDWYDGLDGLARRRPYDLMFAEQFLSHGFGNQLYSFSNNFYLCPFNDRSLLGLATRLPPDRRARLHYNLAILNWRAPELAGLPYARRAVNLHLKAMRTEGEAILALD